MPTERIRLYRLALEWGVESRTLLTACQRAGIDVKNQLSTVTPEQRRAIEALIDRGDAGPPLAPAPVPVRPKPRPGRSGAEPPG